MANVPKANVRTWIVPTTHLDEVRLRKDGYYDRIKVWAAQHGIDVFDYTEFENLTAGELVLKAQERGCWVELLAFIRQKPKATLLEWVGIIANTYMLRFEKPGCSLCMGNQARTKAQAKVFSTSTRNFNNRMGEGAKVYLGSAELAACCALLGRIPNPAEYQELMATIDSFKASLFAFLFFDREEGYADQTAFEAKVAELQA
jgi:aconitase B